MSEENEKKEHREEAGTLDVKNAAVRTLVQDVEYLTLWFLDNRGNPPFMPAHFDITASVRNMRDLEDVRQLMRVVQQFTQVVNNALQELEHDIKRLVHGKETKEENNGSIHRPAAHTTTGSANSARFMV